MHSQKEKTGKREGIGSPTLFSNKKGNGSYPFLLSKKSDGKKEKPFNTAKTEKKAKRGKTAGNDDSKGKTIYQQAGILDITHKDTCGGASN